jgi:hypothetical protein
MTSHDRGNQSGDPARRGGWTRDWRMWTVVALMLAAMAVYILSLDNEVAPGEPGQPELPAAEAP